MIKHILLGALVGTVLCSGLALMTAGLWILCSLFFSYDVAVALTTLLSCGAAIGALIGWIVHG